MPQRFSISGALSVSIAAIVVMATAAITMIPTLILTLATLTSSASASDANLDALLALHEKSIEQSRERFAGRSVFFKPLQPLPSPPASTQPVASKHMVSPPPEKPVYRGPRLVGLLDDEAWFSSTSADELVLRIATGAESSGIGVVQTNPPWSARVSYGGHEFDLTLLNPMNERYFATRRSEPVRGLRMIEGGVR